MEAFSAFVFRKLADFHFVFYNRNLAVQNLVNFYFVNISFSILFLLFEVYSSRYRPLVFPEIFIISEITMCAGLYFFEKIIFPFSEVIIIETSFLGFSRNI